MSRLTNQELNKIKRSKRWSVTFEDIYSRYFFLIFPLSFLCIGTLMIFSGFQNEVIDLKATAIVIFTFGLFSTAFVIKRLYQNQLFESFHVNNVSNKKIITRLKTLGFQDVQSHQFGYITAKTKVSWLSWGEQITIVLIDNELLINSRPTGNSFTLQPITIFKDRKNIRTIINELTLKVENKEKNCR